MTKVYIVENSFDDCFGYKSTQIISVFTNKRKAKIMAEYFNTKYSCLENSTYVVKEFRISQSDWSKELLELQMKELPY